MRGHESVSQCSALGTRKLIGHVAAEMVQEGNERNRLHEHGQVWPMLDCTNRRSRLKRRTAGSGPRGHSVQQAITAAATPYADSVRVTPGRRSEAASRLASTHRVSWSL